MGIAYSLLETDIRAVFALYYFDLGSDLYPSFARSAIALDLFLRLPGELLHNYEALVPTNPIFYKACTSGVAYTFGDFISQIYQGRDLKTLDLARSFRSGAAGFIGHGPLCHFWMLTMEEYLDFSGAWWKLQELGCAPGSLAPHPQSLEYVSPGCHLPSNGWVELPLLGLQTPLKSR